MGSRIRSYAVEFLSCVLEYICCETVYNISTSVFSHKIILLQLLFLFFIYYFFLAMCSCLVCTWTLYMLGASEDWKKVSNLQTAMSLNLKKEHERKQARQTVLCSMYNLL